MSRALLNRMLLVVHGQGDELATPSRYFRTHCSGCTQGCELCESELAASTAPDDQRVIQPPAPLPDDLRSQVNRNAWVIAVAAFSVMAALLELFGAHPFEVPR